MQAVRDVLEPMQRELLQVCIVEGYQEILVVLLSGNNKLS